MGDLALRVPQRRDDLLLVEQLAALLPVDEDGAIDLAGEERVPEPLVECLIVDARLEDPGRLPADLVEREAADLLEGRVDVLDAPLPVGDEDAVARLLDGAGQLADSLVGPAPLPGQVGALHQGAGGSPAPEGGCPGGRRRRWRMCVLPPEQASGPGKNTASSFDEVGWSVWCRGAEVNRQDRAEPEADHGIVAGDQDADDPGPDLRGRFLGSQEGLRSMGVRATGVNSPATGSR